MGHKTFLGSYAATNPTEFFSVASEKFFCLPAQLRQCHPELFEILAEYYRIDPLRWFKEKAGTESPPPVPPAIEDRSGEPAHATAPPHAIESGFIDFTCSYCRNPVSFPGPEAGTLKQCPNCLESMIVPDRAGLAAERIPFPFQTGRLVLRRFQTLDAKDLADFMSNPEALRYLDWPPMSLENAEEWIAGQSHIRFLQPSEYCYFAVEVVQAAKVIGLITFWFQPNDFDLSQFEIIIHPDWRRKGYATEAVRGLLAYAFRGLRSRRLVAQCDARNLPARGLLRKVGLRQESESIQDRLSKGEWADTVGFALLKQEYGTQ